MLDITEEEFIEIIEHNDAQLWHLCRLYTNSDADMRDLYQEIVVQLWHSLPSFKGEARLSTWIYRLAVNTAISMKRKRETRNRYHSNFKKEKQLHNPVVNETPDPIEEDERIEELYSAISKLNASEKAIITMYLEEFSYAEIAYVTEITENHVGVKLNRIKRKLSKIMKNGYGTERTKKHLAQTAYTR